MNHFRTAAWKSTFCVTASVLLLIVSSVARADQYTLDPSHQSIIFGISHLGYSYTYGRFNQVKGAFNWVNGNPAASNFQIAIATASIDSNDEARDKHLKSADFFNANQFPQITFVSTKIDALQTPGPDGETHNVYGNFTMHGVTKQIVLPMKKLNEGTGPYGKYRSGFFCQTIIKRSDFGMTTMIPNIGNEVALTISFEGIRQSVTGSGTSGSGTAGSGTAPSAGSGTQGSGTAGSGSSGSG